jgi:hypothetical protein
MRKYSLFALLFVSLLISEIAEAQMRRRPGRRPGAKTQQNFKRNLPKFKPSINLSAGYGFPNADKIYLPEYYEVYSGSSTQWGPITGALDYQFSRRMSIGLMVTHGSGSASYYDAFSSSTVPVFTAKFDNWSFMLNMVRYIPISLKTTPYLRTAIGINSWTQKYTDPDGNKVLVESADLPDLAYQASLGIRFRLSKHAGLFAEAGYGKYIVQGGLSMRF